MSPFHCLPSFLLEDIVKYDVFHMNLLFMTILVLNIHHQLFIFEKIRCFLFMKINIDEIKDIAKIGL